MTAKAKQLLIDALKLSENERAELADQLLESIDSPFSDDGLREEWDKEIERRLRELHEGRAKTIPWSTVRRRLRSRLRKVRNANSKA
jgi:putative addiction module component (TIGR02574 family)